jgi:hypothetical protein
MTLHFQAHSAVKKAGWRAHDLVLSIFRRFIRLLIRLAQLEPAQRITGGTEIPQKSASGRSRLMSPKAVCGRRRDDSALVTVTAIFRQQR